ncbi:MAG: hypothetical protein NTX37_05635 [Burkholderiales bacterium]|nr:hypothetical protein [Burkholderiales bacterium]
MYGIDYFPACPACGHSPLETQAASPVQVSLAKLAKQIKLLIR